jgi:SWI/SNF-related matrix-associated actin-dependent regulator 1 of chromatin subfamily A
MSNVLTTTINTTKKLTEEQIKRMEENRQKALQIKRQHKSTNENNLANEPLKTTSANTSTTNTNLSSTSVSTSTGSAPVSSNSGKCVYFDSEDGETRFEVILGYNKLLIDLFKTIPSRKYNPDTKRWNFSIKHYDDFINKVKLTIPSFKLEPLPDLGSHVPNARFEAKFFLIDRCRFEVRCEYNNDLQELFKSMKTKRYEPIQKRWSFELKEYEELINAIIKKFNRSILISPLPKIIREIFKEHMSGNIPHRIDPKIDLELLKTKLDPNISKNLLPFQVEGICFAIQQQGRLLLADDMGLGKTVQGLAIANFYKDEWPLIIVSPSSVKFMWKESIKRWLSNTMKELCEINNEELIDNYIQVLENGRQPIDKQSKVVITSYDLLAKNINTISEVNFKVVICDECHLLKNGKAARTKAATQLTQNCKRIILLSGILKFEFDHFILIFFFKFVAIERHTGTV